MLTILSLTTFVHMTAVIGPSPPPSPEMVADIFRSGRVDGAVLPPALIDQLCLSSSGLAALRGLEYIHYVGAPLSVKTGEQLASHVKLVPGIGSTEAGGYFTKVLEDSSDWDYIAFQDHAGAVFEPRLDNLHELVFVRRPDCTMQQIFQVYPGRDRFETNDLWIEHPVRKGLWKIIGRSDDYVYLAHGDGLHASTMEPEIERHESVKAALIGGHGRPAPVLIVELVAGSQEDAESESGCRALIESLRPYIDKVNAHCHPCVELSPERVIFASKEKPFIRTTKGSVGRLQSLKLYEDEISALFEGRA
jgi:acyl-coenzyme A synthetase/AMP-(fatty) acid ligase